MRRKAGGSVPGDKDKTAGYTGHGVRDIVSRGGVAAAGSGLGQRIRVRAGSAIQPGPTGTADRQSKAPSTNALRLDARHFRKAGQAKSAADVLRGISAAVAPLATKIDPTTRAKVLMFPSLKK